MNIIMIEVISFTFFDKSQKSKTENAMFLYYHQSNRVRFQNFENKFRIVMIKKILKNEQVKSILERIMTRISKYFQHLFEIFDFQKIIKLSSHRFYDHKIDFLNDVDSLFRSRIYFLFAFKLQKFKKYLKKNLQKNFIVFNKIVFVSSILFAIKFNDQLHLCVNYRRLNQITKRNRYFILLIEKILTRVQDCKYLIKLNIISIFNKLRINEENEKLIIFVIFLNTYKYRVLFFELTDDSINWQHYMNDLLFVYFNDFCQVYLNDILIYSKFKKKHIVHVRAVLERLKKVDLQMNIEKCEFFKKKIIF